MSSDEKTAALRLAAIVAFRHIDDITCEAEREAVLVTLIDVLPEAEAKLAQDALYHARESRKSQLQLKGILEKRHSAHPFPPHAGN